jgi:hypothetical protein
MTAELSLRPAEGVDTAEARVRMRLATFPLVGGFVVTRADLEELLSLLDAARDGFVERGKVMQRMNALAAEAEFCALAVDPAGFPRTRGAA